VQLGAAVVILASAQAAVAAPPQAVPLTPSEPEPVLPSVVDRCPDAAGSEIVVCGRRDRDERHRLRGAGPSLSPADVPRGPLGMQISESVRMEIEPMQRVRGDGWVDRRVVVRVRIAF
jgi:hypothetical protein